MKSRPARMSSLGSHTDSSPNRARSSSKPIFHVMPRDGWLNDPNGPIYYAGRYHTFYQHVIGSSKWDWGLVWGHASSSDLVNWEHEPVAIEPSVERYDADGCWSGNIAVETDGVPTMLYTGVRLRHKKSSIPLPPQHLDLNLEQVETQCVAQCLPGDKRLIHWHKLHEPVVGHPPSELGKLTGFRDPFVFSKKSGDSPWKIIVGSGVKGRGGTVLLYHAEHLAREWEFKGELVAGSSKVCQDGADYDLGAMWECPFFTRVPLRDGSAPAQQCWMLCVSPYPHARHDRPTNPCLYWLGSIENEKFQLGDSAGPRLLDLGDVLYAPTLFADTERCIMVAWLQELRKGGVFDYAGCLSIPRVLSLEDGRLRQDPAEEIDLLRTGQAWRDVDLTVTPAQSICLEWPLVQALDVSVKFERRQSAASGLLLRSWLADADAEVRGDYTEAILVDWEASELQVVAPASLDMASMTFDRSKITKKVGGLIRMPKGNSSLGLRIIVDHSLVEIFAETGETLTTRVHCASAPANDDALIFFSFGGDSGVRSVEVHEMRSIWTDGEDVPES